MGGEFPFLGRIFWVGLSETSNKMVFESFDGSFRGILAKNMRGNKMVRGIFLDKGLLEDVTSFIVHDFEIGLVAISCERIQDVLDAFVDACT